MRLDGSRRLTVRNRRFVKKIVSPCDLPTHEETDDPLSSNMVGQGGGPRYSGAERQRIDAPRTVGQQVDSPQVNEQHPHIGDDRRGAVVEDVVYHGDDDTDVPLQIASHASDADGDINNQLPIIDRQRRQRKQNVRYSDREYDLSYVAAVKRVQLSGLYIVDRSLNS